MKCVSVLISRLVHTYLSPVHIMFKSGGLVAIPGTSLACWKGFHSKPAPKLVAFTKPKSPHHTYLKPSLNCRLPNHFQCFPVNKKCEYNQNIQFQAKACACKLVLGSCPTVTCNVHGLDLHQCTCTKSYKSGYCPCS